MEKQIYFVLTLLWCFCPIVLTQGMNAPSQSSLPTASGNVQQTNNPGPPFSFTGLPPWVHPFTTTQLTTRSVSNEAIVETHIETLVVVWGRTFPADQGPFGAPPPATSTEPTSKTAAESSSPTSMGPTSLASQTTSSASNTSDGGSRPNLGAIIGGVVGGLAIACMTGVAIIWVLRRHPRKPEPEPESAVDEKGLTIEELGGQQTELHELEHKQGVGHTELEGVKLPDYDATGQKRPIAELPATNH